MAEDLITVFNTYHEAFLEAEALLRNEKWFSDNWRLETSIVEGKRGPTGIATYMYKTNWFNDEGPGIYFDAAIRTSLHKSKELAVLMLVRTSKARAGFSGTDFHAQLSQRCRDLVESWSHYNFNAKWAAQPIRANVPYHDRAVADVVATELGRMRTLAVHIDAAISELT